MALHNFAGVVATITALTSQKQCGLTTEPQGRIIFVGCIACLLVNGRSHWVFANSHAQRPIRLPVPWEGASEALR